MGKIRVSCLWAVCLASVVSRPVFLYAQKAPPAVSPRRESEQALKKQLPAGYQSGNVPSRMVELEPIPVQSQRSQRGLRRVGVRRTLPSGIWNGVKAETAAGLGLSFAYGATFGALYAALRGHARSSIAEGAVLGTAVWAIGYLGWLPAADLIPPIWKQEPKQMVGPIVEHLVQAARNGAKRLRMVGVAQHVCCVCVSV